MTVVTRFIILLLSFSLMGCAHLSSSLGIKSRGSQYLTAGSIPPLRIPPGISSDGFQTYYPVSTRYYPGAFKEVSLVPPGL